LAALCALAAVAASTGVGGAGISNKAEAAGRLGLVDPMIGTAGGGNTVPGPSAPFGFARPSPDTTDLDLAEPVSSGYNPGGRIVGFSQTHVSGTGGGSKYGNFIWHRLLGLGVAFSTDRRRHASRPRLAATPLT
jgi:putative alpha-1,2-mannosidase